MPDPGEKEPSTLPTKTQEFVEVRCAGCGRYLFKSTNGSVVNAKCPKCKHSDTYKN